VVVALAGAPLGALAATGGTTPPVVGLSISYSNGGTRHLHAALTCRTGLQRAIGFLARRSNVLLCRRARQLRSFLASRPDPRRLCSQIYGAPDRALIAGTIGGTRIYRRFARTDGCQVADWNQAALLLPSRSV